MKSLKSLMLIVSLFTGGITMAGCGGKIASDSSQHTEMSSTEKPANDTDSVTNKDNAKSVTNQANETEANNKNSDSKSKDTAIIKQSQYALNDSISRVNERLAEIDNQTKNIKDSLKRQVTILELSTVVALLVTIVSLIVAIRALVKIKVANRRINKSAKAFKEFMEEVAELKEKFSDAASSKASVSSIGKSDYQALASKISALEYRLQQSANSTQSSSQSMQAANDKKQFSAKEGYFGLPVKKSEISGYFKKLLEYRDSETIFSAKVTNGDKAVFSICDNSLLKTLTSYDVAKFAVEFHGCPAEEAKSMKQIVPGEAVLSGSQWDITKKAIINLSSI